MIHDDANTKAQLIEELYGLHQRTAELEAALEKSERTLTDVQRLGCMGSWTWNIQTGEVDWSEEVYRIFGLDRDAFHPEINSVMNRFHPDDRKMHETLIEQAIANHEQYTFEARIVMPDGSIRHAISTSEGHYGDDGNLTRLSGIVQDVTERKRAEQTFQKYFDVVGVIILAIDADQKVSLINQKGCQLLESCQEEIMGSNWFDTYIPEHDRVRVKAGFSQLIAGEIEPVEYFENRIITSTGKERLIAWHNALLQDEYGNILGTLSSGDDITDRRQAEEELRTYREQLEELVNQRTEELQAKNQELETFAYSVSHDLKAPLRGIDGYSRLLLEDYVDRLDEDGRTFLYNIRYAAKQMNQLIEDLLTYSRLERQTFKANRLNPRTLIEALITERANDISERHVCLTVNIPFDSMSADASSLTQILRNLLDNALKFTYTVAEPQIEIGGQETPDAQRLWVRDNGIGFDMHYHDRIFEIFQRLHRAEEFPGTGIGLAIVRKALERMGGRAWAKSQPGAGATFYLEFRRTA
jgi:PAS domain S-box-containing protein